MIKWISPRPPFISYPRTGSHWLKWRMRLVLEGRFGAEAEEIEVNRWLNFTHYGYAPNISLNTPDRKVVPPAGSRIVLLLRDAKPTLGSMFHYMRTRFVPLCPEEEDTHIEEDPQAFIRGPSGVAHFCDFTNDVAALLEKAAARSWDVHVVHYEEMFEPESILGIPALLGLDYDVSGELLQHVYQSSQLLINPSLLTQKNNLSRIGFQCDKYSDILGGKDYKYIDEYMREHSRLRQYTDFY